MDQNQLALILIELNPRSGDSSFLIQSIVEIVNAATNRDPVQKKLTESLRECLADVRLLLDKKLGRSQSTTTTAWSLLFWGRWLGTLVGNASDVSVALRGRDTARATGRTWRKVFRPCAGTHVTLWGDWIFWMRLLVHPRVHTCEFLSERFSWFESLSSNGREQHLGHEAPCVWVGGSCSNAIWRGDLGDHLLAINKRQLLFAADGDQAIDRADEHNAFGKRWSGHARRTHVVGGQDLEFRTGLENVDLAVFRGTKDLAVGGNQRSDHAR